MRLAKVELFGFKSFADRTVFDMDAGITAVLGPNGCGKSNVVDAIKWVLGEQRAKTLRGNEMIDVIFAGSEARKPMGMAEVSLSFDNTDGTLPTEYNEVCVTRRLYRSGESEYLINRQPCRLRDIKDLFLDTGIGTSAYSFIEQGKVEALLAAKPVERRMVFEEAAGVSKYKARRKETVSRLERMQQHLARVNDIVAEVEKNIRSVSRQASNARRWQSLTEDLRTARGRLYAIQWREVQEQLANQTSKMTELSDLQRQEEVRVGMISQAIAELQSRELLLGEQLSKIDDSNRGVSEELTSLEAEKARVTERIRALRKESEQVREEAEVLRTRLQNIDGERARLTTEEAELATSAQTVTADLEAATAAARAREEAILAAEAALAEARNAIDTLHNRRNEFTGAFARMESESGSLSARRSEIETRRASLGDTEGALRTKVESLGADVERLSAEEAALRETLARSEKQVEEARAAIDESSRRIGGRESRL